MTTRANMLSRFENLPRSIRMASLMRGAFLSQIHIQHSDNERAMAKDAAEMQRGNPAGRRR